MPKNPGHSIAAPANRAARLLCPVEPLLVRSVVLHKPCQTHDRDQSLKSHLASPASTQSAKNASLANTVATIHPTALAHVSETLGGRCWMTGVTCDRPACRYRFWQQRCVSIIATTALHRGDVLKRETCAHFLT